MTRNFKALGLVLVGILALVALAAAVGSAGEGEEGGPKMFKLASKPAILTGEQAEITTRLTTAKGEIVCNEAHYKGTMKDIEEKELTITPSWTGECKAFGMPADVEFNGCHYQFTLKPGITPTNETGTTHTQGPMHIVCSGATKEIIIKATIEGLTACTIKIPAQTPTDPEVDTKNEGTKTGEIRDILFTSTIKGIHYEVSGVFGKLCGDPGKTLTDGQLDSVLTVKAYEDLDGGTKKGTQIPFRVIGA